MVLVSDEQLVGVLGVDRLHLRDDALSADRHPELLGRDLPTEHGPNGVLHRGEDERPGVYERAVEVEEDDPEAHPAIVASPPSSRPARGRGPRAGR